MTNESFPSYNKKSECSIKLERLQAEGWVILGNEHLTQVQFSKEAKFEEIPFQTEAQIREKYLAQLAKQAPGVEFEIQLLLDENTQDLVKLKELLSPEEYQDALKNINPEKKIYLVLARKK